MSESYLGRLVRDRRLYLLALTGLGVLLFWLFIEEINYEAVLEWKRNLGVGPFFTALALLTLLGLPMTPFFLLAGAAFGIPLALLGSALALAVHVTLCYWMARQILRPYLDQILAAFDYQMPQLDRSQAIQFVLFIKLTPGLPALLKSYVAGLAPLPFGLYFLISWSVTYAYAVALVLLGESIMEGDVSHAVWGALVLLVVTLIGLWLRRRQLQAEAAAERAEAEAAAVSEDKSTI